MLLSFKRSSSVLLTFTLLTVGLFAPRNEKMLPWFVSFCNSYIAWRWKVSLLLKLTRFKLVLTAVHPSKVLLSLPFKVFFPAVPKCWLWILGDLPFCCCFSVCPFAVTAFFSNSTAYAAYWLHPSRSLKVFHFYHLQTGLLSLISNQDKRRGLKQGPVH